MFDGKITVFDIQNLQVGKHEKSRTERLILDSCKAIICDKTYSELDELSFANLNHNDYGFGYIEYEFGLNYEELKQRNAPQKATSNDMIAKMEQASQVTIVESDYWKALINLNRSQNQQLNLISENQVNEDTISHYSAQILLQLKKNITEQENLIQKELKNQETILTEQAGKMNESMLSVTEPMKDLLKGLKKKWIPIFFGTMTDIQVFFQILSILLEIYLK